MLTSVVSPSIETLTRSGFGMCECVSASDADAAPHGRRGRYTHWWPLGSRRSRGMTTVSALIAPWQRFVRREQAEAVTVLEWDVLTRFFAFTPRSHFHSRVL